MAVTENYVLLHRKVSTDCSIYIYLEYTPTCAHFLCIILPTLLEKRTVREQETLFYWLSIASIGFPDWASHHLSEILFSSCGNKISHETKVFLTPDGKMRGEGGWVRQSCCIIWNRLFVHIFARQLLCPAAQFTL